MDLSIDMESTQRSISDKEQLNNTGNTETEIMDVDVASAGSER
jgi:hypothetical protein